MPGPGMKPATEATFRMPPLCFTMPSIQRSDRSVSARTLRSIIASCSARSISAAGPCRPKPALLTTIAGSRPRPQSSCAMSAGASERCRSAVMTWGLYFADTASSVASSTISFSRRATSATSWPLRANTRASAAPMPTAAPVITVTGLKIDVAILPPPRVASTSCLEHDLFRKPVPIPDRGRGHAFRDHALSAAAIRRLAGHAAAQRHAVARGNPQEIGGAPHQIILEFVDASVRENHLPHHLDDTEAPCFVERAVDQAGEVIKVDRLVVGPRAGIDQRVGCGVIECEARLEHRAQPVAFDAGHVAVDGRGVDQQGGCGEPIVVFLEAPRMLLAAGEGGDEILQ